MDIPEGSPVLPSFNHVKLAEDSSYEQYNITEWPSWTDEGPVITGKFPWTTREKDDSMYVGCDTRLTYF